MITSSGCWSFFFSRAWASCGVRAERSPTLVEIVALRVVEEFLRLDFQVEALHQLHDLPLAAAVGQDQGLERPAGVGLGPGHVRRDHFQRELVLGKARLGRRGRLLGADLGALRRQGINPARRAGHQRPLERTDRLAAFHGSRSRSPSCPPEAASPAARRPICATALVSFTSCEPQGRPGRGRQEPRAEAERQFPLAGRDQLDSRQRLVARSDPGGQNDRAGHAAEEAVHALQAAAAA